MSLKKSEHLCEHCEASFIVLREIENNEPVVTCPFCSEELQSGEIE
jgi:predicted nucleic acid-binding Zn ribbon protein